MKNSYTDNNIEIIRSHKQDKSGKSLEQMAFDKLNWQILSKDHKLAILDLRCRDGRATVERLKNYLNYISVVIGIDCSQENIKLAQESFQSDKYQFIHYDLDDGNLSTIFESIFKENNITGFDLVYGSYILIHLDDPLKILTELFG